MYSFIYNHQGHVHSQTFRTCRTVAALSNPLMREALIGCSGGRIRSLKVAGTNSGLDGMSAWFFFSSQYFHCQAKTFMGSVYFTKLCFQIYFQGFFECQGSRN